MIFYKTKWHINAVLKKFFLKVLYLGNFKFGNKLTFRRNFQLYIEKKGKVEIGNNCFFNNDCAIVALNSVKIGNGTIFGANVKIYDHNHRFADLNRLIKDQGFSVGEVEIGNNCWIGSNVCILKGANIGDNCVIGAGCVISGEIPPRTMVKINQAHYEITKINCVNIYE